MTAMTKKNYKNVLINPTRKGRVSIHSRVYTIKTKEELGILDEQRSDSNFRIPRTGKGN